MKKVGLVLLAAMLVAGCGQRVNTSSPDAYSQSIEAMIKDMPADKQAELKVNAAGADGTMLIDETMVDDKTATAEATKLQSERNDLAAKLAKL